MSVKIYELANGIYKMAFYINKETDEACVIFPDGVQMESDVDLARVTYREALEKGFKLRKPRSK